MYGVSLARVGSLGGTLGVLRTIVPPGGLPYVGISRRLGLRGR
jgi:hypothetical protein